MHKPLFFTATILAGALALAMATPGHAVGAQAGNNAGAMAVGQAISNYRLTEDFVKRAHAMQLDMARNPCEYGNPSSSMRMLGEVSEGRLTLDQAIAKFGAQPGMQALLAKHGLTARDALIGGLALGKAQSGAMVAHAEAQAAAHGAKPAAASMGGKTAAQQANARLLASHWSELQAFNQKMGAISQQRIKANGGKLPACEANAMRSLGGGR